MLAARKNCTRSTPRARFATSACFGLAWLGLALAGPGACASFRDGTLAGDAGGDAPSVVGDSAIEATTPDAGAIDAALPMRDSAADVTSSTDASVAGDAEGGGPGADASGCSDAGCGTNDHVVLFGGFFGSILNDTWTFDGISWQQASPATMPTARYGASIACPSGNVFLFGGEDDSLTDLADTWQWSGTRWTQLMPSNPPPGRASAGVVTFQGKVLVFGGDALGGPIGDTWTWDGTTWTQVSASGPSARIGVAMAALPSSVILFGGRDASFADLSDTWQWDGTSWTQLMPAHHPSEREFAVASTLGGTVVLFGGVAGPTSSETWTWDGSDWTQATVASPPPARQAAGLAPYAGQLVLYGGDDGSETYFDDTWTWNGTTWSQLSTMGPPARSYVSMCGP
jgi:hypothetical protein